MNLEQTVVPRERTKIPKRRRLGGYIGSAILMLTLASCGNAGADGGIPASGPAATPTEMPSPTATATPIIPGATETPVVPVVTPIQTDVELQPGQCVNAPAFSVVQGDVQVNGQILYDNNQNTGLIVEMDGPGQVCAPFGADVQFVGQQNMGSVIGQDTELMKQHGCGQSNGCAEVIVVKFPNN